MDVFFVELVQRIRALGQDKSVIVGIDGRCASGKTTLASRLQKEIGCTVFHMDDYFLRPEQRTMDRLQTPGGNVDYERFYEEILFPLKRGADQILYRPYDCRKQMLTEPVSVKTARVNVVEGSYSCHPMLRDCYDLRVFLSVAAEEQKKRIVRRNGEDGARTFQERWIPMEEMYFSVCHTEEGCDLCLET